MDKDVFKAVDGSAMVFAKDSLFLCHAILFYTELIP